MPTTASGRREEVDVFVPGRVCLFGEHSDWAGCYRRINSKVPPGNVIISGTNQGIFARSSRDERHLIITSTLGDIEIEMGKDPLKKVAESDSVFSYAAGVAYYMMEFYGVGGIRIDNYKTTLPVKKGLSSSAAFCVLVARCFNELYKLNLTKRAEIEAAYQGEIMTMSRCGRMDQGCAYGQVPVKMVFDGELLVTTGLVPAADFHLLIGDLRRQKDTVKILSDLNRAYPFPQSASDRDVHAFLGPINAEIVTRAVKIIEAGDVPALGRLMTEAQRLFDEHLMPVCTELESVRLHEVLSDRSLEQWTYGGKGVGSQGDGCVQFVAKGADERVALAKYLTDKYGVDCFELDLKRTAVVKKALIPVAADGVRMFPATKLIKKCFLPLPMADDVARPVLQVAIEEAISAGVEDIGLIINPSDEPTFRSFFDPLDPAELAKLPKHLQGEAVRVAQLGKRVEYIYQQEQVGYADAMLCAESWLGSDPFMLLLGDHIHKTKVPGKSCARQVVECFDMQGAGKCCTGIYKETVDNLEYFTAVSGIWEKAGVLTVNALKDKPTRDHARQYLKMGAADFYCANGIYILNSDVFPALREISELSSEGSKLTDGLSQLMAALESMVSKTGFVGCLVEGEHNFTGLPHKYAQAVASFALKEG